MPFYKRLLIASGKGGVGKSSAAVGIAAALAEKGEKVLLLDLDFSSRCLDLLCGVEDSALFDFSDVSDNKPLAECVVTPYADRPSFQLLPACPYERLEDAAGRSGLTAHEFIRRTLKTALDSKDYTYFVCDTGGGLTIADTVADLFDMILIPSEQSLTSIRSAEAAATRLQAKGGKEMRLVVCSFDLTAIRREHRAGIIEMIDSCALPCVGVIPFDRSLQKAQDHGLLPKADSHFMAACRNIAGRIGGTNILLFSGMGKYMKKRRRAF